MEMIWLPHTNLKRRAAYRMIESIATTKEMWHEYIDGDSVHHGSLITMIKTGDNAPTAKCRFNVIAAAWTVLKTSAPPLTPTITRPRRARRCQRLRNEKRSQHRVLHDDGRVCHDLKESITMRLITTDRIIIFTWSLQLDCHNFKWI